MVKKLIFLLILGIFPIHLVFSAGMPVDDLDVYGTLSIKNSDGTTEYSFPSEDGVADQVLRTDGEGNITFGDSSLSGLIEELETTAEEGTAPVSDGAGSVNMQDVLLQSEINTEAKLESYLGVDVYTSNDDIVLSKESVEDAVAGLINDENSSHSLITFNYDDSLGALSASVDNNLSLYDNTTSGFLTSDDLNDDSPTNELQNLFSTFSVSGQNDITASSHTDTLTFVEGNNISLFTDSVNNTITIQGADIPAPSWDEVTDKPSTAYGIAFDDTNLVDGILTLTHNLNEQYVVAAIYDNNGNTIIPDEINAVDADTLTVDLSSWVTISGTWYARVVIAGGDVNFGTYVLTVSESDGNPSVANVDEIKFNQDSGFILTDNGDNSVTVSLGSHFKTIRVADQDDIVASGEDTLILEAGENTNIETDASTNTLTITATSGADGDENVKVSENDTTAGYLNGKLVAGTNVDLIESNDGGNETLTINISDTALADSINEDDSKVEVVDTGDGHIQFVEDNSEIFRVTEGNLLFKDASETRTNTFYSSSSNSALSFDGEDDWLNGGDIAKYGRSEEDDYFTFHAWIFPKGNGGVCETSEDPDRGLKISVIDNKLQFQTKYEGAYPQATRTWKTINNIPMNEWVHVVVIWDSNIDRHRFASSTNIYINGVLENIDFTANLNASTLVSPGTGNFRLGRVQENYFNGHMDEVRIYYGENKIDYISTWYNEGLGQIGDSEDIDLDYGWHLDDSTGSTAANYIGTGNLTLENMNEDDWISGYVGSTSVAATGMKYEHNYTEPEVLGTLTLGSFSEANNYYGHLVTESKSINFKISGTSKVQIASDGGVIMTDLATGTSQANAGAEANEIWVDSSDGYTLKLGQ